MSRSIFEHAYDAIGKWKAEYELTPEEVQRMCRVVQDCPNSDVVFDLGNELVCVLAARRLAKIRPLTAEEIDLARAVVESGRTEAGRAAAASVPVETIS